MIDVPFGGGVFIADKSIWARSHHELIREQWEQAYQAGQIVTCQITAMELLYSARTSDEYRALQEELSILRNIPVTRTVCDAALDAMRTLAEHSDAYHRVVIPDYLIAACAAEAGVGVLHYDRDFDRLAEVLAFESRWAADAGTLD
jgi:predicted nucleic acid-binding protein